MSFFNRKKNTVAFATTCWERDWDTLIGSEQALEKLQIVPHQYPFHEKILVINNVKDEQKVLEIAKQKVKDKVLTKTFLAKDTAKEVLQFFKLSKQDFKIGEDAKFYENVNDEWIYYNAIAPLSAIYHCKSDYLLYMTGDCYVLKAVNWIEKAIRLMEKNPLYKVANLTWNGRLDEVRKESYRKKRGFYIAKQGFSDQMFLVKLKDFKQPIYQEIREDSQHFPRGDVFEKRVFSYLKNRGYQRLIYKRGSYKHIDTPCQPLPNKA